MANAMCRLLVGDRNIRVPGRAYMAILEPSPAECERMFPLNVWLHSWSKPSSRFSSNQRENRWVIASVSTALNALRYR